MGILRSCVYINSSGWIFAFKTEIEFCICVELLQHALEVAPFVPLNTPHSSSSPVKWVKYYVCDTQLSFEVYISILYNYIIIMFVHVHKARTLHKLRIHYTTRFFSFFFWTRSLATLSVYSSLFFNSLWTKYSSGSMQKSQGNKNTSCWKRAFEL